MHGTPSTRRRLAAELLGVASDADPTEIRRAFRRRARRVHPDGADQDADHGVQTQRFTELCAARDLLLGRVVPAVETVSVGQGQAGLDDFLAVFRRTA
jgi:hypothetical protein